MDEENNSSDTSLTTAARLLGYAGLLPQALCLGLALSGHEYGYTAIAGGFAYAAAIFSFLGGLWWGQAIQSGKATAGAYVIAVMPSLIAVALFLPWTFGWEWPGPALMYLGAFIAMSPAIDRALGFSERDFLLLRVQLSAGLGVMTVALGFVAQSIV
ncbi:DUF3429 domain-containing protein [Erythrobacter sp. YT30]|uniref:DUF3429 domain-containing protein n=1 Tax=Erythrobacter sp. YT30 TaxID=1735012 RepID=UPI00076BF714|nr:DUF3429 domain-containing protein [Erythrobacter sp. YT30]KWV92798.1 hypothetical protein AUC45_01180 [Erythrobacter sp. YT30]